MLWTSKQKWLPGKFSISVRSSGILSLGTDSRLTTRYFPFILSILRYWELIVVRGLKKSLPCLSYLPSRISLKGEKASSWKPLEMATWGNESDNCVLYFWTNWFHRTSLSSCCLEDGRNCRPFDAFIPWADKTPWMAGFNNASLSIASSRDFPLLTTNSVSLLSELHSDGNYQN